MFPSQYAASTRCILGPRGTAFSVVPAAASTVLFALCERASDATSSARALQLSAAIVFSILAAVHTHVVVGRNLEGWRLIMPFKGGLPFVRLQGFGWCLFSIVLFVGFLILALRPSYSGMQLLLGCLQLIAQASLVVSLSLFDASQDCCSSLCQVRRQEEQRQTDKGTPLAVVAIGVLGGSALLIAITSASENPSQACGWAIVLVMLALQALGIHIMWTITWNIMSVAALLTGNQTFIAIAACIGIANISAPWYIGRVLTWKSNYPCRSIHGLSRWAMDNVAVCFAGTYPSDVAYNVVYWGFIGVDQTLHIFPALMLCQYCAETMTPVSVLLGFAITICWFITVGFKHRVIDWGLFRQGFLKYLPYGNGTWFEPHNVGQIYLFENDLFNDNTFMEDVPTFLSLFALANTALLLVTMHPQKASILMTLGGAPHVSISDLAKVSCTSGIIGVSCFLVAAYKTARVGMSKLRAKNA